MLRSWHILMILIAMLAITSTASAGMVEVDQTGPETFVVSFEKLTRPGGIEGAMNGAKRMAAALCHAAGYEWLRILDRDASKARVSLLPTKGHTAAVEVLFLDDPNAEVEQATQKPVRCTATKKDRKKMEKWLRTLDFKRPEPDAAASETTEPENGEDG